MAITAQVIDSALGRPADGIAVRLERNEDSAWGVCAFGATDRMGYVGAWLPALDHGMPRGEYRLRVDTGSYFSPLGMLPIFPEIVVPFVLRNADEQCHLTVVLAPSGYTASAWSG
jgi:5-hydroxyisourate hydrolase